jgi:hypothetical protein
MCLLHDALIDGRALVGWHQRQLHGGNDHMLRWQESPDASGLGGVVSTHNVLKGRETLDLLGVVDCEGPTVISSFETRLLVVYSMMC